MTNLELVHIQVGTGNKKVETVLAMSSSYSALKRYCEDRFNANVEDEPDHWTQSHYKIRQSNMVIVPENY